MNTKKLRAAFYTYGCRAGLPVSWLYACVEFVRVAAHFGDWRRRRRVARRVLASSRWRGFFDRREGYTLLSVADIPAMKKLVVSCRSYFDARRDSFQIADSEPFIDIVESDDLTNLPELLDFALCEPIVEIVTDYLGTVPRLHQVGVWFTPARERLTDSQLFHLDKPDINFVQVFVNILDTSEENGPFSFLPAGQSIRYRKSADYDRQYLIGDGRATDSDVYAITDRETKITLSGPAGSGGIVDTSRCLHYGSRTTAGCRVVAVIQYVPSHRIAPVFAHRFASRVTRTDMIARLLVPEELR